MKPEIKTYFVCTLIHATGSFQSYFVDIEVLQDDGILELANAVRKEVKKNIIEAHGPASDFQLISFQTREHYHYKEDEDGFKKEA